MNLIKMISFLMLGIFLLRMIIGPVLLFYFFYVMSCLVLFPTELFPGTICSQVSTKEDLKRRSVAENVCWFSVHNSVISCIDSINFLMRT